MELNWPPGMDPQGLTKFETEARKLRYPALGRQCSHLGIRYLLLAQHEDDQAETILERIYAGYMGDGLHGMADRVNIPECSGIWGVQNLPSTKQVSWVAEAERGIQVLRPLLKFSKERLRLTCQKSGISWVEDKTNHDRSFTLRNAARHLLGTGKLPAALTKPSLLNLAHNARGRIERFRREGKEVLEQLQVRNVDTQSGTLSFRLTDAVIFDKIEDKVQGLAGAMIRIVDAISPRESVNIAQVEQFARFILADAKLLPAEEAEDIGDIKTSFTVGGLLWRKDELPDGRGPRWTVFRQPLGVHSPDDEHLRAPRVHWHDPSTDEGPDSGIGVQSYPFGTWQLFDGRFWITVGSGKYQSLIVRPFETADLRKIRDVMEAHKYRWTRGSRLSRHLWLSIEQRLKECAPGKVRFTLPAIAHSSTGELLALPTFGMTVLAEDEGELHWKIEHKHMNLPDGVFRAKRSFVEAQQRKRLHTRKRAMS